MGVPQKKAVIAILAELAEDNVELDFFPIFKLTLQDEDEDIRIQSIDGLWECEERALLTPLIRMLAVDPSAKVRAAAALALGRFAFLAETGKLLERDGRRIADALLETIDSEFESTEVRRRAIEAIAAMSHDRIADLIQEAYESDDLKVKASALHAMGRTCDPKWLPILSDETSSREAELRYEAVSALGEIGDDKAITHVLPMIDDPDTDVQAAAIAALGKIGGPVAKKALTRTMQRPESHIQELAQSALETMDEFDPPLFERRN
jgi:HEAT repeat protein